MEAGLIIRPILDGTAAPSDGPGIYALRDQFHNSQDQQYRGPLGTDTE